jgi:hypothetical protein
MKLTIILCVVTVTLLTLAKDELKGRETISMRCDSGTKLVQKGSSKMDVLTKCGQPDLTESSGADTFGRFQSNTQYGPGDSNTGGTFRAETLFVEKWHYNCGESRWNKTLVFVNGILQSIHDGDKGTGPNKCM